MNLTHLLIGIIIGTLLAGCTGNREMVGNATLPTAYDMKNLLDDGDIVRPYSRYTYKIIEAGQSINGSILMSSASEQDLRLEVSGSKLRILVSPSFKQMYDLKMSDSEEVPFGGANLAGGRLEIMPGFSRPIEFEPSWFPGNAAVSIDSDCNFLTRLKNSGGTEVQKLVSFIDARGRLEGARCEILGTFQNVPQLRKLVKDLSHAGRYTGNTSYVLRLNWSDTFALVRITRKGE